MEVRANSWTTEGVVHVFVRGSTSSCAALHQTGQTGRLDHVVLDELDWELERRGHRFARYADDCNIMVKSKTAGKRVMARVLSPLRDIDQWLQRKLRCYIWKQWGRSGYRQLRKRGVSVREAWNTSKSAHGPWRLSKTPALSLALPARDFSSLGLPSLAR